MPYKDKEEAKQASKERMSVMRGRNKEGVTKEENVTPGVTPGVTLWPPSKFISPEEDMKMEDRVIEAMLLMSGSRLGAFRMLSNVFTPNKVRNSKGGDNG